jgi:DNA ligase (NAD+)
VRHFIGNNLPFDSRVYFLSAARDWGLRCQRSYFVTTLQEVFEFIEYWDTYRHELPETGWVVIKKLTTQYQDELGYAKSPRAGNGL